MDLRLEYDLFARVADFRHERQRVRAEDNPGHH